MLFNSSDNIFQNSDGVIFDALTTLYWMPAAMVFVFGLIFTLAPNRHSNRSQKDKSLERYRESQWVYILLVGVPLLLLSFVMALSSIKDHKNLALMNDRGEIRFYRGEASILSNYTTEQEIRLGGQIFKTNNNNLSANFSNGCPRKCKIREGMMLEVAFLDERIVGIRKLEE